MVAEWFLGILMFLQQSFLTYQDMKSNNCSFLLLFHPKEEKEVS
jgi:hypothetical protein